METNCTATDENRQYSLRERIVDLYEMTLSMTFSILYSRNEPTVRTGMAGIQNAERAVAMLDATEMVQDLRSMLRPNFNDDESSLGGYEETLSHEPKQDTNDGESDYSKDAGDPGAKSGRSEREKEEDDEDDEDEKDSPNAELAKLRAVNPKDTIHAMRGNRERILKHFYDQLLHISEIEIFFAWNDKSPQVLCLRGPTGTYKTMSMLAIVQGEESLSGVRSPLGPWLSYFFCGSGMIRLESPTVILKSLIQQVLRQQPCLVCHLKKHFTATSREDLDNLHDFSAVSSVFHHMVKDQAFQQTYFVLDAPDQTGTREEVDPLLRVVASTVRISANVKWLLSLDWTRHGHTLHDYGVERLHHIGLDDMVGRGPPALVHEYTSSVIVDILNGAVYQSDVRDTIIDQVCQKSKGSLLWIDLACKTLAMEDLWNVLYVLDDLPIELPQLYDHMKQKIDQLPWKNGEYCNEVLGVMATAYGPLSVSDLTDLVQIPSQVDLPTIVKSYLPFLDLIENRVSFISTSAKRFIRQNLRRSQEHHARMTRHCLEVLGKLCSRAFDTNHASDDSPRPTRYITIYWMRHLSDIDNIEQDPETTKMVIQFVENNLESWVEMLESNESLAEALMYARELEIEMRIKVRDPTTRATLLPAIRELYQHVCFQPPENRGRFSRKKTIVFLPNDQALNRQLQKYRFPKLLSHVNEPDTRLVHNLLGHVDYVRCCAYSHNGELIATSSDDLTVRVWETKTGRLQLTLTEFSDWVYFAAFSPAHLLAATDGTRINIWDVTTGLLEWTFSPHLGTVVDISFSHDGSKLAAALGDTITVWDVPPRRLWNVPNSGGIPDAWKRRQIDGHAVVLEFARRSPYLLSTSTEKGTIWEIENDEFKRQGDIDVGSSIRAATLSPKGTFAAFATEDGIQIWNIKSPGTSWTARLKCDSAIYSLKFSYDDLLLAAGSADQQILIWKHPWVDQPSQMLRGHSGSVYSVSFSPRGPYMASCSADASVRIWNCDSQGDESTADTETMNHAAPTTAHTQAVDLVACSPDGQLIASTADDTMICIWDGNTGALKQSIQQPDAVLWLAFSGDGRSLLSAGLGGTVRIWDPLTTVLKQSLLGHTDWVRHAAFSHSGQQVVAGSDDNTVRIWDITSGEAEILPVRVLEGHQDYVYCVAFSIDGSRVASGGDDATVRIWDAASPTPLHCLTGHEDRIVAVTFMQDREHIVSSSLDKTLRIWNTQTGHCEKEVIDGQPVPRVLELQQNYLLTETGAIQFLGTVSDIWPPPECPYAIDSKDWWIKWNRNRLMSLPDAYRPQEDDAIVATRVQDYRVVIGCKSGRILLLRFDQ
ncbi:WD40-repeat-containing domain protein [Aspergillus coremiiformis]|uniref:WD40-repeat-containing domain protein n=1 Tax=Aspergillus coremiiformis TaxID=138285 RepID=A0A5N6ZGV7_9EURO|nr:WD40-repeat-containing domain protein [Aspergillus coremiiformis]